MEMEYDLRWVVSDALKFGMCLVQIFWSLSTNVGGNLNMKLIKRFVHGLCLFQDTSSHPMIVSIKTYKKNTLCKTLLISLKLSKAFRYFDVNHTKYCPNYALRTATFDAFIWGTFYFGAHDPFTYGWRAYHALNSLGITILLSLLLYLTLIVSNASYSAANVTMRKPKYSSIIVQIGIIITWVIMSISIIGLQVTDDFRFNAIKHLAIGLTIAVAGSLYTYSLRRLKGFIASTIPKSTTVSSVKSSTYYGVGTKLSVNSPSQGQTNSKHPMLNGTFQDEDSQKITEVPKNMVEISSQDANSASTFTVRLKNADKNTAVPERKSLQKLSTTRTEFAPSRISKVKSQRMQRSLEIIKRLNKLTIIFAILAPVVAVSFLVYGMYQLEKDIRYSEQWQSERRDYHADIDFGMWIGTIANGYFLLYISRQ
eukprot:jgi/Bigna1/84180/fgenesh1_pg.125_\